MCRRTLIAVACLLAVSVSALGQTMKVTFKDPNRRPITGKVEKTDDGTKYKITVFVGGKPVMVQTVDAKDVKLMERVLTPEEIYQQKLKTISPGDANARFKLGEWAFGQGMLKIAEYELEQALKIKPNHESAKLLLKQVKAKIAAGTGSPNGGNNGGTTILPANTAERKLMITERDLNRIRLGELAYGRYVRKAFLGQIVEFRSREPARVAFNNKVQARFVDMMRNDEEFRVNPKAAGEAFRRWKADEQFWYIMERIERSDWAIKDDLVVKTDPKSIKTFHRAVWPMLAKSCGSTQCHGAEKGKGQFKLFSIKANDTLGLYSNFMILDMFKKGGKMIDRDYPRESRLLEAGLPPTEAKWKHPAKAKATPTFTSVTGARYKNVLQWIESLKGPPRPFYGVKYKLPFGPDPDADNPLKDRTKAGGP